MMNQASTDPGKLVPPSYRQRETADVVDAWDAGVSVSIVGVGSAGKSNFVQHLATAGATEMPGLAWPSGLLPVLIDANMLGPLPATSDPSRSSVGFWAGCELLLHRIFMTLFPFEGFTAEDRTTLYQAYEALQDGSNPLFAQLALRYLELGLNVPLRMGLRLAFIFDEFERLAALLPVEFFQSLRGLRDTHKRQLMYATVTRAHLPHVMEQAGMQRLQFEPFIELFSDRVVYIAAHAPEDAEVMINELLSRRGTTMNVSMVARLLAATGGHPGLLRAAVHAALERPALNRLAAQDLSPALLMVTAVTQECSAIWNGLTPSEQVALKVASHDERIDDALTAAVLQQKGLLGRRFEVTPPVFASYVQSGPSS